MNLLRIILLAAATSAAAGFAQPASADKGMDNVVILNPRNLKAVLTPDPSAPPYIVVEVCPSNRQECSEEVEKLALTVAVAEGGRLGPEFRGNVGYFAMDPTPANLQALSAACLTLGNTPGAALCDASHREYPFLLMFRTDGSKSLKIIGPADDSNLAYILRTLGK
jgi:hypothetical protein